MYIYIHIYIYLKETNFIVCDHCEHQKITYFFHTDIFRNCIPSSVCVCLCVCVCERYMLKI